MENDEKKVNDGTLLGKLHDKDFSSLKDDVESVVAKKIHNKIIDSKKEFIDKVRSGV